MRVFIAKYALTQGIYEVEGEVSNEGDSVEVKGGDHLTSFFHGKGKDWCGTKEEAIARVEEMRKLKINNLKKQIKKLEEMKFE